MCDHIRRNRLKSIEFSEEEIKNIDEIAKKVFFDSNHPGSVGYKRKLIRPKLNWFVIVLKAVLPVIIFISTYLCFININSLCALMVATILCLIYILLNIRKAIICFIRIYQKVAPESIRNKCRFEPSCSEYMIMSIEKHGLFKGMKKGINRLKRCNINKRGYDYP